MLVQVTVSNGDAYNVATEIDTEVYNQIASWYNEDKDTAGNGTLPLAPSGPGSQPSTDNAFVRWWRENWGKNWFVAVVIIVCVVIAGNIISFIGYGARCIGLYHKPLLSLKSLSCIANREVRHAGREPFIPLFYSRNLIRLLRLSGTG